jgi:hypothetical protein
MISIYDANGSYLILALSALSLSLSLSLTHTHTHSNTHSWYASRNKGITGTKRVNQVLKNSLIPDAELLLVEFPIFTMVQCMLQIPGLILLQLLVFLYMKKSYIRMFKVFFWHISTSTRRLVDMFPPN